MNKYSWRIIETILLRYPQVKKEYTEYMEVVSGESPKDKKSEIQKRKCGQSIPELKVLKRNSSYADRMRKEIEAVEEAYKSLKPEEQAIIQTRYWTRTISKPVPYLKIQKCSYSERQMKRIVLKMVLRVGKNLGEIE